MRTGFNVNTDEIELGSIKTDTVQFASTADTDKTRVPVCPDCGSELRIDSDAGTPWALDCDCAETPRFEISQP